MRRWQTIRSRAFDYHIHQDAYAALVLAGGYEEAGDRGRVRVEAGEVVLHDRFEAHVNRFFDSGAMVLNLRLPREWRFVPGQGRLEDVDRVVRVAESNSLEAAGLLLSLVRPVESRSCTDWQDILAAEMIRNPSLSLSLWGEMHGLTPWAVSRGFLQVFGVSPSAFRARVRARHAWKAIERGDKGLAVIAAELGFADQPHMSRSVKSLTGESPAVLRSCANAFKTRRRSGL